MLVTSTALASAWLGGTSGNFNDITNWDSNPSGQNVYIGSVGNQGGPSPFTATISSNLAFPIVDLQIARGGGPAVLNHTAGTAVTGNGNWIDVGTAGGTGTYNIANVNSSGGTLTGFGTGSGSVTGQRIYVGGVQFSGAGGTGNFNVNTTGTIVANNDLTIGTAGGTGVMRVDAGTVTTGGWNFIGRDEQGVSGNGTLKMSGGTFTNSGRTYIGINSTGLMELSGTGTYNNTGDRFAIGENNSSVTTAQVNMLGGTFNTALLTIGGNQDASGKGTMTVSNASALVNTNGEIWVGQRVGSQGILNISAGTVQASGWIAIGRDSSTGVVNLSGGQLIKNGDANSNFIIGSINGNGTVNQTGGNLAVNAGDVRMGEGTSTALWDMSGGTATAGGIVVGWSGGTNELKVRGTALLTPGHLNVGEGGNNGSGLVTQTGGTVTANNWVAVGVGSTQTARYNISGGTLNAQGLEAGADSTGIINLSAAGIVNIDGNTEVPTRNGNGTFNITGGTLNTIYYQQGGRDGQTGTGATFLSGGNLNVSRDLVVQRPAVGTGAFTLSGGTLAVNGNLDATLGTFTFTGGRITRSNAGIITYLGNLTTGNSAAGFKLDADKTFAITGAFNISNGVSFDINGRVIPAYSGSGVDTGSFTLGTEASIVGTYGALNTILAGLSNLAGATLISETAGEGTTYNPLMDSVYWLQDNAGTTTLQYSVVPEPASLGLIACTMLGGAFLRRRRR